MHFEYIAESSECCGHVGFTASIARSSRGERAWFVLFWLMPCRRAMYVGASREGVCAAVGRRGRKGARELLDCPPLHVRVRHLKGFGLSKGLTVDVLPSMDRSRLPRRFTLSCPPRCLPACLPAMLCFITACQGLMDVSILTATPVVLGVLTCTEEEQAVKRSTGDNNHGRDWGKPLQPLLLLLLLLFSAWGLSLLLLTRPGYFCLSSVVAAGLRGVLLLKGGPVAGGCASCCLGRSWCLCAD